MEVHWHNIWKVNPIKIELLKQNQIWIIGKKQRNSKNDLRDLNLNINHKLQIITS